MTIFRKSLLTLSIAAFGLSSLLVIAVLVFMNSLYYETNAEGLANTAKALFAIAGESRLEKIFAANGEENFSGDMFPFPAAALPGGGAYRLTLIDRGGNVRRDSRVSGELVNHLGREEVEAALEGREGKALRNSVSTGMRQIYFALPVRDPKGEVAGVFRLSQTVPGFWMRISPAAMPFLLFACLLFLIAFGAILVFSHTLSESLVRLVDIAEYSTSGIRQAGDGSGAALSGETLELFSLEKALRGMAKELKTRLEKAEAEGRRLEAILNGISEAVIAADSRLVLSLANPKARLLFGLGDIQNLSLLEATRSTELEQIAGAALAEGRLREAELQFHGQAGERQRFQVFAAPLSGAGDAAPEGIVMVLADITRLTRLEQVRRDFVANVSHELRTPIQLIKGFSETLLDNPLDDIEQIRRFIGIIHKNSGVMENLTNDLLVLAGLEDDGGHHEMKEQDVAPLFAEAVSMVEERAKKKQIEISVNCPAELRSSLHGHFIIQALINLLDNGIKYSAEKSKVQAEGRREGNQVILEVRDQGIGIPPEHLERIFERFYRIDKGRGRGAGGAEGTGLGLSIVRHIALLHKGTAEVESRAGEGSVFRIRLPC